MPQRCPECGGTDFEADESSGETTCTQCGTVVEESTIVSSVEFVESAGGSSSVVGQFVSATSGSAFGSAAPGTYGLSRESRQLAIDRGRRLIQQLAASLRLPEHLVDAAHQLYILALQRDFIQGRRTMHVIAACLYIACRREKAPTLLIDFADALKVNVYTLGACFLKFIRFLNLELPVVDPSLYVHRFASKLEFGEKEYSVCVTAMRLISRMGKDWIQTGRRPSGICGACLLVAARIHGFRRTVEEVVGVVHVHDATIKNRLAEFEQTQSARLTPDQFHETQLEIEHDPPSYIRGKLEEQGFGRGGRALLRHRRLAGLPLDSDGVLLPLTNGAWPTQREIEGLAAFIDGNKGGSEGGEGEGRGAEGSGGGEGEETEERSRAEGSEPSTAAGLAGIEAAVGPGQLTAMSLLRDSVHAEWFARLFGSSEDRDIWRSSDSGPGSSSSAAAAAPLSPPGAALSHSAALSSEGKEERRRSKDGEAVPSTPVSVLQRQVKRLSQRRKELLEEDGEEENNSDGDDSGSEGAISVASSAVVPLAGKVLGRQNAKQLSHGTASLLAKKEALAELNWSRHFSHTQRKATKRLQSLRNAAIARHNAGDNALRQVAEGEEGGGVGLAFDPNDAAKVVADTTGDAAAMPPPEPRHGNNSPEAYDFEEEGEEGLEEEEEEEGEDMGLFGEEGGLPHPNLAIAPEAAGADEAFEHDLQLLMSQQRRKGLETLPSGVTMPQLQMYWRLAEDLAAKLNDRLGEQTSNKRQRVASSEEEAAGERLREWEGGGKEGKEVARGNEGNEGNAKTQPQGKDAHAHRAEEEEGEEKERKEDDSSSLALLSTMSPSDLANANFGEYVSHKDDGQLSDLSDSEIEEYILTKEEATQKRTVWEDMHGEFMQERRMRAASGRPVRKQPKRKAMEASVGQSQVTSASDAAREMLQATPVSKKINYDALKDLDDLFETDGDGGEEAGTQDTSLDLMLGIGAPTKPKSGAASTATKVAELKNLVSEFKGSAGASSTAVSAATGASTATTAAAGEEEDFEEEDEEEEEEEEEDGGVPSYYNTYQDEYDVSEGEDD